MSDNKNPQKSKASEKKQLLVPLRQIPGEAVKDVPPTEVNDMKTIVKGDDSKESKITKILAFKCPECGGEKLQWERRIPHYQYGMIRAIEVDEDGHSDFVALGYYIGSESTFYSLDVDDGSEWSCTQCGHVLEDDYGEPIEDEESLLAWMLLHGEVVKDLSELKGSPEELEHSWI